ncbi:hypothetical protein ACFYQQ_01045 [Streptomyces sp. NPDC005496]|uniref:hypothetical protein n=1 Tax=unclassified Streptomyces TaxID=2593676 RepID=UPI00339E20D0
MTTANSTAGPRADIARASRNPKHTTTHLETTMPDRPYTDPRILALAKARQQIGNEPGAFAWDDLNGIEQDNACAVAAAWLSAAVAAGIAPPADRPSDDHAAVWVDDEGFLYGEYQTSPSSHGDAILRLVWEPEVCSSKREMEEQGAEFRLLGWSK